MNLIFLWNIYSLVLLYKIFSCFINNATGKAIYRNEVLCLNKGRTKEKWTHRKSKDLNHPYMKSWFFSVRWRYKIGCIFIFRKVSANTGQNHCGNVILSCKQQVILKEKCNSWLRKKEVKDLIKSNIEKYVPASVCLSI